MVSRFPALPRGHRNPAQIYYAISAVSSFCFSLSFTVNIIYHATTVGLNPIQLILVGTVLELTCYVFEIPTGVVADRYSRRLSVIIGFAMIGVGFVIEGSLPVFATVLMAQVIWGIGSTFTSGATQAWIIDEIGENQAAHVLTRGQQIFVAAAFTGTLASGGLSLLGIQLPIVLAGMGLLSLAIGLVVAMPENNFTPSAANDVGAWTGMIITARDGLRLARSRPVVRGLLIISLLAGLSSEAVDRLWQLHLMRTFTLPPLLGAENPAIWFAAIELVGLAVGLAASLLGNRYATRWLGHANPGGVLAALTAVQVAGVCALALSGWLWLAVLALWFRAAAVVVAAPVLAVWLNGSLEPSLRATVLSIDSQTGAIGQLAGGPPLGLLAKRTSVPTALLASACILAPTVAIFLHYRGRSANHADG